MALVPVMSAQKSNAASLTILGFGLFTGALFVFLIRPIGGYSARGVRVATARARRAARSIGCTLPQPPTIANFVAVSIVTLTITALLRGPIFDLTVAAVGTQQSPEQLAATAERSTWLSAGWAAHIPGLTLISGVVAEEVLWRGPLVVAVVLTRRYFRGGWPKWAAFMMIAGLWILLGYLFGIGHITFSALNAVHMVIAGLLWGGLAIWTRSLIPSITSHAVFNLLADW
ncbi:CPBP family intramembrane glutamic endopeptidase [Rhodococcus sp. 5A-K4]|uniref:CPBP family intramembrane glutamic endopeptidase n=1 Tax=Rhodococcus TaxID=1827 RepID=UPI00114CC59E|nr:MULTISPECIES: CPBP family intramembrane glutamic endopeptidase [unclassified Rhodococcus (in: high G+C Gram-positive bacteria)]